MNKEYIKITTFDEGEMIFNKGDLGDCMYEILSGSVGIYLNYKKPNEKLLAVKNAGEIFGEIALIEVVPRTAAAISLEDKTSLRIIGVKGIAPYFKNRPEIMELILNTMAQRIKQGRILYLETCGVVAKYKEVVDSGEKPDEELSKRIEKCLETFDRYQSKFGSGV